MIVRVILLLFFVGGVGTLRAESSAAWGEIKSRSFVIYFESRGDRPLAEQLLRRAEDYYRKVGQDIGYSRTNKMWTWTDRVQIFLFATQESFMANTGQPAWSTGYADRDSRLFKSKTIVTFTQDADFIDGLLPHEISHLVLHDFIGDSARIPVWFDEGVAQLEEKNKRPMARDILRRFTKENRHIPFEVMFRMNIRQERDPLLVQLFYAQSLSVVDFLMTRHGAFAFARLCRGLRDGKSMDDALTAAYPGVFKDRAELEKKWIASLNQ